MDFHVQDQIALVIGGSRGIVRAVALAIAWVLPALLTAPASLKPVLVHLGLPAEPPPLTPARGPPLDHLDQTPTFDLSAPAPVPEYEFDQTVSWSCSTPALAWCASPQPPSAALRWRQSPRLDTA